MTSETTIEYRIEFDNAINEARAYDGAAGYIGGRVYDQRSATVAGIVTVWLTVDAGDAEALEAELNADDSVVAWS